MIGLSHLLHFSGMGKISALRLTGCPTWDRCTLPFPCTTAMTSCDCCLRCHGVSGRVTGAHPWPALPGVSRRLAPSCNTLGRRRPHHPAPPCSRQHQHKRCSPVLLLLLFLLLLLSPWTQVLEAVAPPTHPLSSRRLLCICTSHVSWRYSCMNTLQCVGFALHLNSPAAHAVPHR